MKTYTGNYKDGFTVRAYERGGYFILRMTYFKMVAVATKHSKKAHAEEFLVDYEKKFESKNSANKYFIAIKKDRTDLKLTKDEPNKYLDNKGQVCEW